MKLHKNACQSQEKQKISATFSIDLFIFADRKMNYEPRALLINGYDFFFYSMEEDRMHIHIEKGENDAKFWLEPKIELVYNHGFTSKEIKLITKLIEEYERAFKDKWNHHFGKE